MDFEMPLFCPTYTEEPFYMNEFQAQFETGSKLGDDEWFKNAPFVEAKYPPKVSETPFWISTSTRVTVTVDENETTGNAADGGVVVSVVDGLHRTLLGASKGDMYRLADEADVAAKTYWRTELAKEARLATKLQKTHNTLKKLKIKFNRDKHVLDRQTLDFMALEYSHHKRHLQGMKDEWFAFKQELATGIEARLCDETKRMAAEKDKAFQLVAIICRTFIIRDTCEHILPLCSDETVDEVRRRSSAEDICRLVLIQHGMVVTNLFLRRLRETREAMWPMIVGKACYEQACEQAIKSVEQLFIDALLTNARQVASIQKKEADKRQMEKKKEEEEQKRKWREERRLTRSHKKIKRDGVENAPEMQGPETPPMVMPFAPTRAGPEEAMMTQEVCP